MKILNLSKDLKIPGENAIAFESFIFNGGEPHIKLQLEKPIDPKEEIFIIQRIQNSDDFILLLLATDALQRTGHCKISALLPYFPAARQDRVMVNGEPLSLKIYTQIMNAQNYERVIVFDPHSDVTGGLLNRVEIISNTHYIKMVLEKMYRRTPVLRAGMSNWGSAVQNPDLCLVAPDAGAVKKIHSLAYQLNIPEIITCEKIRDIKNGKLSGFKVHADDLKNKTCLIVDDICDGGGTFIGIAKELKNKTCLIVDDICDGGGTFIGIAKELKNKNAGPIYLAISHGIFSKGVEKFDGVLDGVFTTDSFKNINDGNVEVIHLNKLLGDIFNNFIE